MDPNWVSRKIAEFYRAPDKTWETPELKLSERFPSDDRLGLIHNWQKKKSAESRSCGQPQLCYET